MVIKCEVCKDILDLDETYEHYDLYHDDNLEKYDDYSRRNQQNEQST